MFKQITLIAATILVAGCGSDNRTAASPGGIWAGILTNKTQRNPPEAHRFIGMIDEDGDGFFTDTDTPTVYRVTAGVNGAQFTAYYNTGDGGQSLPNGLLVDTGTIPSTVQTQAAITGDLQFSGTSYVNPFAVAFDLNYDLPQINATLFNNGSSSALQYSGPAGSSSGSIVFTADLSFTLQNDPCTGSGRLTLLNPNFNAYGLTGSYACNGGAPIAVTGFAYYDPKTHGPVLEFDDGKTMAVFGQTVPS